MTLRFKRSQRYSEWLLAISVGQMSEPLLNISKLPLRIPGSPQLQFCSCCCCCCTRRLVAPCEDSCSALVRACLFGLIVSNGYRQLTLLVPFRV